MRAVFAAAALATLMLAVPAAAQPDAAQIMRDMTRVLAESHPPEVEDYSLTLKYRSIDLPVYVVRDGDEWEVVTPEDSPLADFASMAVFWPELASMAAAEAAELDDAEYVRADRVDGRAAHVLTADLGNDLPAEGVETAEIFVDARTHHVLRMHLAGTMSEEMGGDFGGAGGRLELRLDMLDHQETGGLVLPGRVRLRMRMELPEMAASERAQMRLGIAMARRELEGNGDPESEQMLMMMDLFSAILTGDEMDIPMTVEDVRVNAGPPEWVN